MAAIYVRLLVIRDWTKPSGIVIPAGTVLEVKDFSAEALQSTWPENFTLLADDAEEEEAFEQ